MEKTKLDPADPTKAEMLDYIFEMLRQLGDMAALCDDPALAGVLNTLADSHTSGANTFGTVVPFSKASAHGRDAAD